MKRNFYICIIVIMLIPLIGCDVMNTVSMKWANNGITPTWLGNQSKAALKVRYIGNKPHVYAKVNGKELLFLLDTGASFTILDSTEKVKSLNLTMGDKLAVGGWGDDGATSAHKSHIDHIDFGSFSFQDVNIAYVPIIKSKYYLRADEAVVDGVIGHDLMQHFAWTFDRETETILASATPYVAPVKAQALPFNRFLSKISVNAQADFGDEHKVTEPFIIDTGSRHYVKLSALYVENNKIEVGPTVTASDFGLSGQMIHTRFTMPELQLGKIKIPSVKTNLVPNVDEDDLWVIGSAIFKNFVTTIDYHTDTLYLEQKRPIVVRYNLIGLELRKIRSGEFVVRYVMPDLPTANLAINVGDLITKLNGVQAKDITQEHWLDIAGTAAKHTVCWVNENANETCHTIQANAIFGYSS